MYVGPLLRSIRQTTDGSVRVLVVDNRSRDDSASTAENEIGRGSVVRLTENLGFAYACNLGARLATTEYVVFLNNDTLVGGSWLTALLQSMRDGEVAAACGKVLSLTDSSLLNSAGGLCDLFGFAWNRGNGEPDMGRYDRTDETFYAPGICLAVRRDLFLRVGGFDESYFMYLEDLDCSWRLRLAGYRVVYTPESIIRHRWMSASKHRPDVTYLFHRNRLRTILKNHSSQTLSWILPVYVFLQVALSIWVITRNRPQELIAILRAIAWNLRQAKSTVIERRRAQSLRKVPDKEIMKHMYRGVAGILFALGRLRHPALV